MTEKRITAGTIVPASIAATGGMAFYMTPGMHASDSMTAGTLLVGLGGIIFLIPKLGEHTSSEPMESLKALAPDAPVHCLVGFVANQHIEVRDARGQTAALTTDEHGRALFPLSLVPPVQVTIAGRPADGVHFR